MADLIDRQAAIDAVIEDWHECCGVYDADTIIHDVTDVIENLPPVQPEPLTDYEQRIFLAAMEKERAVCKKLTDEWDGMKLDVPCPVNLLRLCAEIERKVKAVLWTI